jgi:hypothetical protein
MALADQLLDQAFDLVLVLVVGLLQRPPPRLDQRLQLSGPPSAREIASFMNETCRRTA